MADHQRTMLLRLSAALSGIVVLVTGFSGAALANPHQTQQNVIMLIADGMGYNHVDAASLWENGTAMYQDPSDNPYLEGEGMAPTPSQVYQHFPVQVGVETGEVRSVEYSALNAWEDPRNVTRDHPELGRQIVTDSSAASTALSTGTKTRSRHLGIDRNSNPIQVMSELAADKGVATGVVTSARFFADTPAGFGVHTTDRDTQGVVDQMLASEDLDVIMGGGHPEYNNDGSAKGSFWSRYIQQSHWDAWRDGKGPEVDMPDWTIVDERADFQALATAEKTPDKVLGFAQTDGALFHDRPGDRTQPFGTPMAENVATLSEMTLAAINILDNTSDQGFFLMAEAATVDSASHAGELGRTIEEMVSFNQTVQAVVDWVERESSWAETTVIVTADHETGLLSGKGATESGKYQAMSGTKGQLPAAEFADWTDGVPGDRSPHYHTNSLVPLHANGKLAAQLNDRAVNQDEVRGKYLHLADIGSVVRQAISALPDAPEPDATGEGDIPVEATIPDGDTVPGDSTSDGALVLSVSPGSVVMGDFKNAGDRLRMTGQIPAVKVTDTRAQSTGWTLNGSSNDLRSIQGKVVPAESLGWVPELIEGEAEIGPTIQPQLSGGPGLAEPTVLGQNQSTDVSSATFSAQLNLEVPMDTRAGTYTGMLIVSLFPED